jgi:hypothetical protein
MIANGTIVDADVNASAAIAASKISGTAIVQTIVDAKGDLIVASANDAVGRLAVGATNGHVLTVDSTESLGVKWAAAAGGGGGSLPSIGQQSGANYSYIYSQTFAFNNSNVAYFATANVGRTHFFPYFQSETTTFDRIAIRSASTFSGTASIRLGVYNNSNYQPSSVVFDAGTVSVTAANQAAEITISETLTAGWYWMAFSCETATAPTTNKFVGANVFVVPGIAFVTGPTTTVYRTWVDLNTVSGSLPDPPTSLAQTVDSPLIVLRKA